jgi:hypothetical protein
MGPGNPSLANSRYTHHTSRDLIEDLTSMEVLIYTIRQQKELHGF